MTRARPIVASSGISSRPLPPRTKCRGASMCVPVWDPIEIVETLAASPCSMSSILSIRTGGLSGQWTMPVRRGTETSIHPAFVFASFPGSSVSIRLPLCSERLVEVEGGADKGQVREGLREVAQGLPAAPDLLRIKPQVVGVGEHLLEDEPGLLDPSCTGEGFDEPERAQAEGALFSHKAVGRLFDVVAVHEAVGDQPALPGRTIDCVQGTKHSGVLGRQEEDEGHDQVRGVQGVAAVALYERLALGVPPLLHDVFVDLVAHLYPPLAGGGEGALVCKPECPVQGDPAH